MTIANAACTIHPEEDVRDDGQGKWLDVRIRILIVLATSVVVLILSHPLSLALLCLCGMIYMGTLRRWKVQLTCYCFFVIIGAISILFLSALKVMIPMMRSTDPSQMFVPLLRMLALLHAVLPLALTLRLRNLLSIMKSLNFPRVIFLPLAVTIRFIPGLVQDFHQIRDCLRLRGYSGIAIARPRLWLLPVVFRCLHLSDELSVAAELKGIGYTKPTHIMPKQVFPWHNAAALIAVICIFSSAIWLEQSLPRVSPLGNTNTHQKESHEPVHLDIEDQG